MLAIDMLDVSSRWAKLRLIGNSSVAKSTIAVPILGYFILFNSDVVEYLRLHTDFCAGKACGVSWRLYFLYFGCFFVAIGASTYALFCPTVAKIYPGASDFFEAEKTYFSGPRNLDYLFGLIEKQKGAPAKDPFDLKFNVIAEHKALASDNLHALADVMGEYYVLQNISKRPARIISLLAYSLGIFLILVPTVLTFVQVFERALQQL
ncbi:hypothetical protein [Bradyrhizobium sp. CCBAU 51765]|uniref:hypothetical protein n=1 Tax=Bradyrhizobium sp. CCBAU 51765 TaxID=1325102 RepID=UPI0018890EFB|nr:hypothetical protein [Bradyrhizobium sp. CCBAU 51765]QOZ07798.1 hypothetical protein XH96_09875 [Bradyrhizobium sp. CCBAU 51765]